MHTILIIFLAVLMFGFMIFFHELGHFTLAKVSGIKVNEFAIGFGPKLIKKKKGDTTYSLRALPLGGFVSMEGEDEDSDTDGAFNKAPVSNRIAVVIAGGCMNLLLGLIILFGLTLSQDIVASNTISFFYDDASSHISGLELGDEIVAINGRRVLITDDIIYEMERVPEDGIADITVKRDGKRETLSVKFDMEVDKETGARAIVYDFKVAPIEVTFTSALAYSFKWAVYIAKIIFRSLLDLVTGNVAINALAGPVGIVNEIREAATYGVETVLYLMGIITINLGVCNLLPLPALDGGRLIFLLFEGIFHKRVNPKYEAVVHLVGMALLLLLMVVVTYNDISRLI